VYPISLLLIRTIIHYHVSSIIDLKSFRNTFNGLSYWGEQMQEKRWSRHVARAGEKRVHIGFECGSVMGTGRLRDLGVHGRIILTH